MSEETWRKERLHLRRKKKVFKRLFKIFKEEEEKKGENGEVRSDGGVSVRLVKIYIFVKGI